MVRDVAELPSVTGLLVANEWLDDVPLDVVEQTTDGPRLVLVDADGAESLGPPPDPADRAWLDRWWPLAEIGDRAEVGRPRDDAWAAAVGRIDRGVAVAIDYGHEATGRPVGGTLAGYRAGALVPPVPDGRANLTAHVALDSVAAAGRAAGAGDTRLDDQRTALLDPRRRPAPAAACNRARTDPDGYLRGAGPGRRGGRADRPVRAGRVPLAGAGGRDHGAVPAGRDPGPGPPRSRSAGRQEADHVRVLGVAGPVDRSTVVPAVPRVQVGAERHQPADQVQVAVPGRGVQRGLPLVLPGHVEAEPDRELGVGAGLDRLGDEPGPAGQRGRQHGRVDAGLVAGQHRGHQTVHRRQLGRLGPGREQQLDDLRGARPRRPAAAPGPRASGPPGRRRAAAAAAPGR